MILETKLSNLDNKPIKVNKKSPPRSINPDLTPFYFTALFIGAKNSGKSYGLSTRIFDAGTEYLVNSLPGFSGT